MAQIIKGKTFEQVCAMASVTLPVAGSTDWETVENVYEAINQITAYFKANGETPGPGHPAVRIAYSTYGESLLIWDTAEEEYEPLPAALILTDKDANTPWTITALNQANGAAITDTTRAVATDKWNIKVLDNHGDAAVQDVDFTVAVSSNVATVTPPSNALPTVTFNKAGSVNITITYGADSKTKVYSVTVTDTITTSDAALRNAVSFSGDEGSGTATVTAGAITHATLALEGTTTGLSNGDKVTVKATADNGYFFSTNSKTTYTTEATVSGLTTP